MGAVRLPIFTMHPRNFSPHHTVTTFKIGEWHYNCVLEGHLDDCSADPSRCGVDAQGIVDGLLGRFGAGGLAVNVRPSRDSSGGVLHDHRNQHCVVPLRCDGTLAINAEPDG